MNKREIKHLRWAIAIDQFFAIAAREDEQAYHAWLAAMGLEPVGEKRSAFHVDDAPLKAEVAR